MLSRTNATDTSTLSRSDADFGLAVFFEPGQLPRTDLGLEGTPWFLAPENLDSEFYPASDLWSAGVMAYQLLSGFMPFDDRRNRSNPALSQVCHITAL
jgi:calcium-dependent protein kinase